MVGGISNGIGHRREGGYLYYRELVLLGSGSEDSMIFETPKWIQGGC